jgi:Lar family restriction alleviation protein
MGKVKIDLIHCPHCGGEKLFIDNNGLGYYGEKPNAFWVVCKTCFASGGPATTKKEAAENWNRRTA